MSNYDLSQFLGDSNMQYMLRGKLLEAKEITKRVHPQYIHDNEDMTIRFSFAVDNLERVLLSMLSALEVGKENISLFVNDFQHRMNFHKDRGLNAVKFIYERLGKV